jgi:acyl carrier protein
VNADDVKTRLTTIFRTVFDDNTISLTRESTADDIEEWDSLNQIRIILAAQEEFGFKMDVKKINSFANVGQMIDYIVSNTNSR